MLSREEQQEIRAEFIRYPTQRAACLEALKIVQQRRRWVDDAALKDIADFLGMSVSELDGVATCYNLVFRKPVGRHVILLCNSICCWVMRYDWIRKHLLERLGLSDFGQTTADGRFTLLPTVCLGMCDHAPAMMLDDDVYGDLTPEKIDQILQSVSEEERLPEKI